MILRMTMMLKKFKRGAGIGKNLIASPKIKATKRFEAGPAIATKASSLFGFLKLAGFMGTGFAQPKIGPRPAVRMKKNIGRMIDPNISKCLRGLRVSLPDCFAVGSPSKLATLPWETSWITIVKRRTMIKNRVVIKSS